MKRVLSILALAVLVAPVRAEVGPPEDIASRARGAGKVVVARVQSVRAQFETNRFGDQLIVSHAVLEVLETLKGSPQATLQLAIEGGTVGGLTLKVSDLPSLEEGERGVFFVNETGSGDHSPHNRGKGILKLNAANRVEGDNVSLEDLRQQVRGALSQGRGGR